MVKLFYTTYTNVDIVHYKIFCAKCGKGGIKGFCERYPLSVFT